MRKFIYEPGIDEPICMVDVADSNAVYYYHFDGLGSVAALSDVNNVIVESYSYDVFGAPTVYDANYTEISKSAIGNPYMFTARRVDDETALYYYRARYYTFDIGRFLQTDPMGYFDSLNLYTYCGNDPLNLVDPYGLCAKEGDDDTLSLASQHGKGRQILDEFLGKSPEWIQEELDKLKKKGRLSKEDKAYREKLKKHQKGQKSRPSRQTKDIIDKITTNAVVVIAEVLEALPSDEALNTAGKACTYVSITASGTVIVIVTGPAIVAAGPAAVEAVRNVVQNPEFAPVLP